MLRNTAARLLWPLDDARAGRPYGGWHRSCTFDVMSTKFAIRDLGLCLGLGLSATLTQVADAAPLHEVDASRRAPSGYELIAFEAPGCSYCPILRRDVAPSYPSSRAGKVAPLRFIDINDQAAATFELTSPVTMVPTVVLVRDGVEIGRIAGYVGPANMHRLLDPLLPSD